MVQHKSSYYCLRSVNKELLIESLNDRPFILKSSVAEKMRFSCSFFSILLFLTHFVDAKKRESVECVSISAAVANISRRRFFGNEYMQMAVELVLILRFAVIYCDG